MQTRNNEGLSEKLEKNKEMVMIIYFFVLLLCSCIFVLLNILTLSLFVNKKIYF